MLPLSVLRWSSFYEVFAEEVEKLNLLKEEVEFWIFYRNWFPEQQDVKVKMGVGATSEFSTVKRLLWVFCGGSGKTECFKEEVVFWIFWRKWFPEQQSIKLNMGVGATSELSTVKQLLLKFLRRKWKNWIYWRRKWSFEFSAGFDSLSSKVWN